VLKISLTNNNSEESVIDKCPCVNCSEIDKCGKGQMISPEKCQKLFDWLMKEIKKEME